MPEIFGEVIQCLYQRQNPVCVNSQLFPYPVHVEKFPVVPPGEVLSSYVLGRDLKGEAECDLVYMTEGPTFGSLASICGKYGRLYEVCSVVSDSVLSFVADLSSLTIHDVEALNRPSILELRVGA